MSELASRCTALLLLVASSAALAEEPPKTYGWRGNWTGLYPDATPPVEWGRIAKGVVAGTTCQAAKPADGAPKSGQPLTDAMIRDWLIIGPFPVENSVNDFAKEQIPGEVGLAPAEGDKVGERAWQRYEIKKKSDIERWGGVDLEWADLTVPLGYTPSSFAYAHTWLHCARAGKVAFVVDHNYGLKVWVNGEQVYAAPKEASGYGSHYGISRQKLALVHSHSPRFEMALKEGWNRLLVKVGSPPPALKEWRNQKFTHCLLDVEPAYEEKNIVWKAEMPERTNACPVVVGDRIFTPAEPDELLCLDKATGKVLWRRFNSIYEATSEADLAASPVFKEKLAPLAEELAKITDYDKGLEIRRQMRDLLLEVDKKKYHMRLEGHLEGHFGIVGFTTTPVSDGKHVWAFTGFGVVACYGLDGTRKWIRRLDVPKEISYSCSPALIGGKLCVVFNGLYGLDAATGEVAWSDPKARGIASLLPARIRGTDIVTTFRGEFYRVSDGKRLWANPHIIPNDTGWSPGVFIGDTYYLSWSGIGGLLVEDFSAVAGDEWKPTERHLDVGANHRRPSGEWLDRWTAGSPLIIGDTFYGIDQYGVFYALDLKTGKPLYHQDAGFDELHTYNAIGVGASATLGGKHIYVIDNQGMCVVIEQGPAWKPVAVNHIETVVDRGWPWAPQELLANGPPVFDGNRIYLRGEKYLYCIGEK